MNAINRRHFLALGTVTGAAGIASLLQLSCVTAPKRRYNYAEALGASINNLLLSDNINALRKAADRCAETIINRGTCFIASGALENEHVADIPYLPPLFRHLRSAGMALAAGTNDIIVSAGAPDEVKLAHERGVPLISVTAQEYGLTRLDTRATQTIICSMPTDGTVSSPFPLTDAVIGAITGEAYERSGGIGKTGERAPETARRYLELLHERLLAMNDQTDNMHSAIEITANTIINGGSAYIIDTTGLFRRNPALTSALPSHITILTAATIQHAHISPQDCVIYLSLTSNAREDLAIVNRLTASGAPIIAVCPHGDAGGFRVFKQAAVAIDNNSPERTGIIPFDGGKIKFLHTGHIVNTAAAWNIIGAAITLLAGDGRSS